MMRIATIDVGTNTILLLVADFTDGNRLAPVHDEERFVRLGEGVDASGVLTSAAMERVMAAMTDYADFATHLGAEIVSVAGTSASRDAANTPDLAARVRHDLGLDYEVISGESEALWAFRGALSAFPELPEACVLDVGGGSTELISGPAGDGSPERVSLEVGAVRLTERFFPTLPPAGSAVEDAAAAVHRHLESVRIRPGLPLIGAAGTVAALARLAAPEEPGRPLPASAVRSWRDRLLAMTADEVRALDPKLLSGRADVFAAGVLIVDAVMRHLGAELLLPSPRGLRHGLALRWLARQRGV